MMFSKKQISLNAWTKQKWKTKSGKKSSDTGERYLPEKAIKALSSKEYRFTTKLKRKTMKKGKQFSKQPKFIVEKVIQPIIKGENPTNKEYIWHKVYNLLRDSGQKGMPIQALSGIDIALWDILSKKANLPLYQLLGGKCNNKIPVYGYGMMLQNKPVNQLI